MLDSSYYPIYSGRLFRGALFSQLPLGLLFPPLLFLLAVVSGCSSHRAARATSVPGGQTTVPAPPRHVDVSAASTAPARALLSEAEKWLGTPYKYGGTTRGKGVDCSGLVNRVFADALSISLPRNSAAQAEFCREIDRNSLDIGDLVFFSPRGKGKVNHVGLYIGEGMMVHASGSRGVVISSLSEPYFMRNYRSSGRVRPLEQLIASSSGKRKKKPTPEPDPVYADGIPPRTRQLLSSGVAAPSGNPAPEKQSVPDRPMEESGPPAAESPAIAESSMKPPPSLPVSAQQPPEESSAAISPEEMNSRESVAEEIRRNVRRSFSAAPADTVPSHGKIAGEEILKAQIESKVDSICSSFFE